MIEHTCKTCDWYCYGTWDGNTCDKWEKTIAVIDITEDMLDKLMNVPTASDLERLHEEIDRLDNGQG